MNKHNHTANLPMADYLELIKITEQDQTMRRTLSKAMFELIKVKLKVEKVDPNTIRLPYKFETESFIFYVNAGRHGAEVSYQTKEPTT